MTRNNPWTVSSDEGYPPADNEPHRTMSARADACHSYGRDGCAFFRNLDKKGHFGPAALFGNSGAGDVFTWQNDGRYEHFPYDGSHEVIGYNSNALYNADKEDSGLSTPRGR